jgi:tetratricopeptide (TPR) repeat protein
MNREKFTSGSVFAERYQIIEELGKGGMGRVYRAIDKKLNEEVALKVIRPEIAVKKTTLDRFSNEIKIARKIVHKNVGRMYHLSEEDGVHYITMEYVPGEDLRGMLKMSKRLEIGTALSITRQILEGLAEAHRQGVVHRDLKPSNIMLDQEGQVRILDFGIARAVTSEGITEEGVMIGTPEYMSPEQVEGSEVDPRSDLYSLGVILFEMVTGRVPFEADTPFAVGIKHKSTRPPNPREYNAGIPESLNGLILKCLEKERAQRFQNADDLLAALAEVEKTYRTTETSFPKKKTAFFKEVTAAFSLKKIFVPGIIVIALAAVAIIVWRLFPKKEAALPLPDKPSLAVMYFKNNTGDADLDHWRIALADLLVTDLSQSKFIRVLSGEALYNILENLNQMNATTYSSEVLREVASRGKADRILVGNFSKAGDTFRISATLQDGRAGEVIDSVSVEGVGEESFYAMVDDLTRRIKAGFKIPEERITADTDSDVETITTRSPEAYKIYSEGRQHHLKADYWKSISTMQRALEIDPEFAMAWRSVAVSYSNMHMRPARLEAIQKAFALRDRVSDRERYIIEADYYKTSEKTYDRAMAAYRKLLELYPDDYIGNTNLGILYFELEEWDKAIALYERNIRNNPDSRFPYENLAEVYEAMGLYDRALAILERFLVRNPNTISYYHKQARIHLFQGKYDQALAKIEKTIPLDPKGVSALDLARGHVSLLRGDLAEAEKHYRQMPETADAKRIFLYGLCMLQGKFEEAKKLLLASPVMSEPLASFYLRRGRPQEALIELEKVLEEAEKAESTSRQVGVLCLKGLAVLHSGAVGEASKIAEDIRTLVHSGLHKKNIRYYHYLTGMIELERRNYARAVSLLTQAVNSLYAPGEVLPLVHAWFIDALARAHYEAGNLDKAREQFEKIGFLHIARLDYGEIYARSLYMLGKIAERQGDRTRASGHFRKFLDLWNNADPGLPEVEDARKKI